MRRLGTNATVQKAINEVRALAGALDRNMVHLGSSRLPLDDETLAAQQAMVQRIALFLTVIREHGAQAQDDIRVSPAGRPMTDSKTSARSGRHRGSPAVSNRDLPLDEAASTTDRILGLGERMPLRARWDRMTIATVDHRRPES
jgi:hypothetical protein